MNAISPTPTAPTSDPLLRDQSVAKQLLFGNVLEENLFPYPAINERDREVLGMIVESIDRFLEDKEADFARWDRAAQAWSTVLTSACRGVRCSARGPPSTTSS